MAKSRCARTKDGLLVDLIETQEDIESIRRSQGCFGRPQIGYYSYYLGPNDGGYVIFAPEDVEII